MCFFGDLVLGELKAFLSVFFVESVEGNLGHFFSELSLSLVFFSSLLLNGFDLPLDDLETGTCRHHLAEKVKVRWFSGSVLCTVRGIRDLVLGLAFHCSRQEDLALGQVEVSVPDFDQILSNGWYVGIGYPLIWKLWIGGL